MSPKFNLDLFQESTDSGSNSSSNCGTNSILIRHFQLHHLTTGPTMTGPTVTDVCPRCLGIRHLISLKHRSATVDCNSNNYLSLLHASEAIFEVVVIASAPMVTAKLVVNLVVLMVVVAVVTYGGSCCGCG